MIIVTKMIRATHYFVNCWYIRTASSIGVALRPGVIILHLLLWLHHLSLRPNLVVRSPKGKKID